MALNRRQLARRGEGGCEWVLVWQGGGEGALLVPGPLRKFRASSSLISFFFICCCCYGNLKRAFRRIFLFFFSPPSSKKAPAVGATLDRKWLEKEEKTGKQGKGRGGAINRPPFIHRFCSCGCRLTPRLLFFSHRSFHPVGWLSTVRCLGAGMIRAQGLEGRVGVAAWAWNKSGGGARDSKAETREQHCFLLCRWYSESITLGCIRLTYKYRLIDR